MTELKKEINELKRERNAIILAHYYTEGEVQDIADYLGDSLYLAHKAKETDADVIVFAGVEFMAETAKILNPNKTVLLPDKNSGCSLADDVDIEQFRAWRNKYPDSVLISYINCSTEVKALTDIICTSTNAEKIVASVPKDKHVLFGTDKNLGSWLKKTLNRDMEIWDGSCEVHREYSFDAAKAIKKQYPDAYFAAHPECPSVFLDFVDFVGSTSAIMKEVLARPEKEIVLLTEKGLVHELRKKNPEKTYIDVPNNSGVCNICPHMKLNTLEKILNALKTNEPQIRLEEELRLKALKPLERMLELS
jgi:quinolinate synthase